jgi:multidrug resistance efflux pump
MDPDHQKNKPPVLKLLELGRRARHAENDLALQFILVNQTHELIPYLLAALWIEDEGIVMQSGVTEIERNSPFILWLSQLGKRFSKEKNITRIEPTTLNKEDMREWENSLPAEAIWIPILSNDKKAGLLVCREASWSDQELALLKEWIDMWDHAWKKMYAPSLTGEIYQLGQSFKKWLTLSDVKNDQDFFLSLWKNKRRRFFLIIIGILFIPVPLTILAPAELVASHPAVIRLPIEGVVDEFFVKPNEKVVEGQPLFKLDLTSLKSRLQIAQQETQVASTEYRQSTLQSLNDPKSRTQLAPQEGKASEKKLETEYVKDLLDKAQIKSPREGVTIFDDPSQWIGKPVQAGERVMIVANEKEMEIEAWVAPNNAIELPDHAKVTLYLNTSPLTPIEGVVKSIGYEAIQRPDGTYAYRLRAMVQGIHNNQRIGLKGTAKISGHYVPMAYWIFRKPLAFARQFLGV